MQAIAEWHEVDSETFLSEIVAANRPAVIRQLARAWPSVEACRHSAAEACRYLAQFDIGKSVYTIAAPPSEGGRFFYRSDLRGLNFKRGEIPLKQVLAQIEQQAGEDNQHAIAVQSLSVRDILPAFERDNPALLTDTAVAPTMWIGTAGKVAPHYDVHRNLACVVAGKRRFLLYPPGEVASLYPGPVLNAPGGVPVSLVNVWDPDLDRHPRYAEALAAGFEATLEPGDAVYIPGLWWHGVESLERVNVLVNYWWGGIADGAPSPNDSLLHAMLAIAGLDTAERAAWRHFFDFYVFRISGDPAAHLPAHLDDLATSLTDEQRRTVKEFLSKRLEP